MVKDIRTKADETEVFTGEVEKRTTICPECGQPAGEGKFCTNCGAPLAQTQCPNCGAQLKPGIKFCSECGTKL
jgi:predicted amidophosphoribosyltransferase